MCKGFCISVQLLVQAQKMTCFDLIDFKFLLKFVGFFCLNAPSSLAVLIVCAYLHSHCKIHLLSCVLATAHIY